MYSDVDYCRYKTVLSQFKNLTRLFILSTSIISSFAFAGAAEDRNRDVLQAANDSKYSSATGKNYTVGGVSSNNGTVSARVDQRVVVGGSSAEVKTKVSFPADFKDVARTAGKLARTAGGLYLADKAFQGLMDGVDYVMDPKNNQIVKKPDPDSEENKKYSSQYFYVDNGNEVKSYSSFDDVAKKKFDLWKSKDDYQYQSLISITVVTQFYDRAILYTEYRYKYRGYDADQLTGYTFKRVANPDYKPDHVPEAVPATDAEILAALKKALESNNPALAAAIAEAIKAAYTPDNSLGQSLVDIPANGTAMDATDSAVDAVRKAGKSTGEEPTSGGKPGYYKITDGDKTIEGYVYPTDGTASGTSDSNTVTNPDGSTTTTGTTATNWPNFCDWAGVVCGFIDWVKEDPEGEDELELPEEELEKQEIDKDLLNVSGHSCPNALQINFKDLPFNMTFNKSIDIQPFCNKIEPLKYVLQLITICLCAFMFLRL